MTAELTTETRELLAALRDMLTVPEPADRDDWGARDYVRRNRTALVIGTLNAVVNGAAGVSTAARMLREDLTEPLGYATRDECGEVRR